MPLKRKVIVIFFTYFVVAIFYRLKFPLQLTSHYRAPILKSSTNFFFVAKASKARLELIKAISLNIIADLKAKADDAYKAMNDWLGARFLKEMERYDEAYVFSNNTN